MRVAYVCLDPGVPVFGCKGCSIHVQEILRAMLRRGWRPELFVARTGGDAPNDLKQIPVTMLDDHQRAKTGRSKRRSLGDARSSSPRQCKSNQDVHDRGVREWAVMQANARLGTLLPEAGPWDAVYERHALFSSSAMRFAHDQGIAGVLEVNAPLIAEQAQHRILVNVQQAERHAGDAFHHASCLIGVSRPVADYLEATTGSGRKIHVVSNGVDVDRFAPRTNARNRKGRQRDKTSFVVGFVGTLKPWHGVADLITALFQLHETVPHARLLIVGDGPQREDLERQVAQRGLVDKVEFTGAAPHDEIPDHLSQMDVAVAPYPRLPDFYFSPLKIYEYFAAGRPVVASRIGGLDRVIQQEQTGLLVEPGHATELVGALRRLATDRELCDRLGQNARETACRHHSWLSKLAQIASVAGLDVNESYPPTVPAMEEVG